MGQNQEARVSFNSEQSVASYIGCQKMELDLEQEEERKLKRVREKSILRIPRIRLPETIRDRERGGERERERARERESEIGEECSL